MPKPDIPTGGRLYHFHKVWEKISTDQWTQSVIRNRYRIQFRVRPRLSRVVPQFLRRTPTDTEKFQLLESEVQSLLDKHAIKPVSSAHPMSGFYSRLFLVHKKSGGWRPVISHIYLVDYLLFWDDQYIFLPSFSQYDCKSFFFLHLFIHLFIYIYLFIY